MQIPILDGHGGWFSGLEYVALPFLYEFQLAIILILDFIKFIIKKLCKFDNKNLEEQKQFRKKFLKIIIAIPLIAILCFLGYWSIIDYIDYTKIEEIKENAEIVFYYDRHHSGTYKFCIDFNTLEAKVIEEPIYVIAAFKIQKITENEFADFINSQDDLKRSIVYDNNNFTCSLLYSEDYAISIQNNITNEIYIIHEDAQISGTSVF